MHLFKQHPRSLDYKELLNPLNYLPTIEKGCNGRILLTINVNRNLSVHQSKTRRQKSIVSSFVILQHEIEAIEEL